MARFLLRKSNLSQRKWLVISLAFLWCTGLLIGVGSFYYSGNLFSSVMRMAVSSRVSIVNLLIPSLLPFLFSAFAVYLHYPHFLMSVCFLKSWSFGFVSACCMSSFGSAGWFLWQIVMFSDILSVVLLWWYWLSDAAQKYGRFAVCASLAAGIICVDYYLISPFLVKLLEF